MACGEGGCVIVFSSDICKCIFAKSEYIKINIHIHTYSGIKGERERERRETELARLKTAIHGAGLLMANGRGN